MLIKIELPEGLDDVDVSVLVEVLKDDVGEYLIGFGSDVTIEETEPYPDEVLLRFEAA